MENYSKLTTEKLETVSDMQHYLYEMYYKDVFRTIYFIINDKDASQDLVNESFITPNIDVFTYFKVSEHRFYPMVYNSYLPLLQVGDRNCIAPE